MAYGVDRLPDPPEPEDRFEVEYDYQDGLFARHVYRKEERKPEPIIAPYENDVRHAAPLYLRPQAHGLHAGGGPAGGNR